MTLIFLSLMSDDKYNDNITGSVQAKFQALLLIATEMGSLSWSDVRKSLINENDVTTFETSAANIVTVILNEK